MTQYTPPPEHQQRLLAAQNDMAEAQHAKEVGDIIEIGRNHFGGAQFDEASGVVAAALGPRTKEFMTLLRQFDKPVEVINHLADNERRLEAIAKMPTARQIVELGRIEAQMSPNGHARTSNEPVWKNPEMRTGRVSDADWKANLGDNLSDRAWNAEFDRRQATRGRR